MKRLRDAAIAALDKCAPIFIALKSKSKICFAAAMLSLPAVSPQPASAGDLFQAAAVPVNRFGIATGGRTSGLAESQQFMDLALQVLGANSIIRTGLVWDPTRSPSPNFNNWSSDVLETALTRGMTVLPVITSNYNGGSYRMPTDAQWELGLRWIVRMYGPNGIYKNGGTYPFLGKNVTVAPHPDFQGLYDYELWNEPNAQGNLAGAMTPQRVVQLVRIGSAAMRDEAAKQGFDINIIGPAIGGISVDYLNGLWQIDNNYFSYINTQPFHAYIRFAPTDCDPSKPSKLRCIKTFDVVRSYLDSHGGAQVHLGTTEAGTAGDKGLCLGPQVRSEQDQATISTQNILWLRGRPYLKFDFWITTFLVDSNLQYGYACTAKTYDIPYWESKLGLYRADLSMKPWAMQYRDLVNGWR